MSSFILRIFIFTLIFASVLADAVAAPTSSPRRRVVGVVTDSVTGERLPFVNVYCKSQKKGVTTDLDGVFSLIIPVGSELEVTSLGYASQKKLSAAGRDTLRFLLSPATSELQEVVVRPKKQKYSKKNNPAVELMRRVRADRKLIDPNKSENYSYDSYDKIVLALNNYNGYMPGEDGKVKGKLKAIAELVDTGVWTGKRILDLSLKEKVTTRIFTGDGADKTVVRAKRSNGVDKNFDENYTRVIFEDFMREVDVYDNDIAVMRSRFVSPLSPISADFYMFHLEDTVMIGNDRCVELSFAPHNAESNGFNGKLYVPVNDSVKWVRRVMMRLPKAANVNYVDNMMLSQTFTRDSLGFVHKTLDDMILELTLVGSFGQSYLSRQSRYDNFSYSRRHDLEDFYSKIGGMFEVEDAAGRTPEFWQQARMLPLSKAESFLAVDESPYRKIPLLKWTLAAVELFVKGYVRTGKQSKFDIGPIDTFVSNNGLDGWRFSVGGMTTANLSKHLFARGFVGYGIDDKRFKYSAELAYSFKPKKYHSYEFPVNGFRLIYSYDTNELGQNYAIGSMRNLLNSFKRMKGLLSTYQTLAQLQYQIEWRNNLSLKATLQYQRQESSKYVPFLLPDGTSVNAYTQNSLKVELRYAPGEKFMQTNSSRHNINYDALVLILSHEIGPKGWLGSAFTLNRTEFAVKKRFWLSAFGYTEFLVKAGKLWNQVQFPALLWQNANISYTIRPESFSLLNPMEFAVDQYASLFFTYNLNGLIFNRIPLIKKLGLREVFTFNAFMGSLTKKNNPALHDNLYQFPYGDNTRLMGKTPYMEIGVGIANILTFLRLDYIWRLSYRDNPSAPNSGLRFSFQFGF